MRKYGMAIGIVSLCISCCLFFVVGTIVSGMWWLLGVPFAIVGMICVIYSDKLNNGKQKRAEWKQALYKKLEEDKEARNEILKNIYKKGKDKK